MRLPPNPGDLLPAALSCLLALSTAAQADRLQEQVNRALDDARPALLAHLREVTQPPHRPGELALVLLAAIHDGVPTDEPAFTAAVERLAKAVPEETYDLALRLLVMEVLPTFPERAELARRDVREMLAHRDGGGFHYSRNPKSWDLSNTQYAALGLRAAKALGVTIERSVWARMAKQVGDLQDNYGGFPYGNRDLQGAASYASMTAAGIAVLAICRQALGEESQQDPTLLKQIGRGWLWLDRNKACLGSTDERWSYYFHYGLERAAILCDVEKVGGADWYAQGAQMFVRDQLPGGGWAAVGDGGLTLGPPQGARRGLRTPVSTAFAVLFLRRKFQKVAGPITPHIVTLAAVGPKAKVQDVDDCAAELVRRGKAAMPEVLQALRSEIEPQRRAAGKALLTIAGDGFGYDAARDGEQNRDAIKKAELWFLRNR